MKNKKVIILIITIVIALLILGYIYIKKQENQLEVTMYYTGSNLKFDPEVLAYKKNKIELTPEQQKEIVKLYKKTNTKRKEEVLEAFIGQVQLEFSDGNVISMDKNNSNFAHNGKYCIRLAKGFKEYILSIID